MSSKNSKESRVFFYGQLLLLLAFFVIVAVILIDLILFDFPLLAEGRPTFSSLYILRTCLIALGSGLFVFSVTLINQPQSIIETRGSRLNWNNRRNQFCLYDSSTSKTYPNINLKKFAIWALILLSTGFVIIFLLTPRYFNWLGSEDMPVELLSAIILLVNSGIFVCIAILIQKNWIRQKQIGIMIAIIFAFCFFITGMEEISWGQRYLGINTPEKFAGNMQNEINLHNFATNETENVYYFTSFLFLILLPFVSINSKWMSKGYNISLFIPSTFIIFSGVAFVSYNYDMWNILITQISFFVSLFILVYLLFIYYKHNNDTLIIIALILLTVASQVIFLVFGHRFVRLHDVTEYKEFLIPIAFLIYAVDTVITLKKSFCFKED